MELSILYFKGLLVKISIIFPEDWFLAQQTVQTLMKFHYGLQYWKCEFKTPVRPHTFVDWPHTFANKENIPFHSGGLSHTY